MLRSTVVHPWDFATASLSDMHGGQQLTITIDHNIIDDLKWVRSHRAALETEIKLRSENEALHSAWAQYQTVLNLVLDVT